MIEKDDIDWPTYHKYHKERDDISKKYNNTIQYRDHRAPSKRSNRKREFERYINSIVGPSVYKYSAGDSQMSKEADAISKHRFRIIDQYDQLSKVELGKEIDSLKAEKEAFLKKYAKSSLTFEY